MNSSAGKNNLRKVNDSFNMAGFGHVKFIWKAGIPDHEWLKSI